MQSASFNSVFCKLSPESFQVVRMPNKKSKEDEIVFETFTIFPFLAFRTMLFTLEPLKGGENYAEKFQHFVRVNYYRVALIFLPPAALMIWAYAVVNSEEIIEALSAVP